MCLLRLLVEEEIFSIAGHIFSLKRRRLGTQPFIDLVWSRLALFWMKKTN